MKNPIIWTLLASHLFLSPAFAQEGEASHQSVEERLNALEAQQSELYLSLAQKKAAGLGSSLTENLTFSGLIEVETSGESIRFADGSSETGSDLVLATAQLGFGMKITEAARGNISLLYEEDNTELELDEAAVDINQAPLFGRLGRIYLPFGVFNSHFVSAPLTQELGETRETAALIGFGQEMFSLSAFLFNGDAEKNGEADHLRDWGTSLVMSPGKGVEFGASYLSDLADSDAGLPEVYQRRVGGWSAFVTLASERFGFSGEYLGALRRFSPADLDEDRNGRGDKPRAWNLEAFCVLKNTVELAVRYEGSSEFSGNPQRQYGADVSWSPWPYTTLALEYLRGEYATGFSTNDFGNTPDRRDLITAQMAFAF